jgi:hypothetical protein
MVLAMFMKFFPCFILSCTFFLREKKYQKKLVAKKTRLLILHAFIIWFACSLIPISQPISKLRTNRSLHVIA